MRLKLPCSFSSYLALFNSDKKAIDKQPNRLLRHFPNHTPDKLRILNGRLSDERTLPDIYSQDLSLIKQGHHPKKCPPSRGTFTNQLTPCPELAVTTKDTLVHITLERKDMRRSIKTTNTILCHLRLMK